MSYVLFVFVLVISFFAASCNADHPNFEPNYSGAPPEEDLDQYLDTKAIFAGVDQVKGARGQLDSLLTLVEKLKNYDIDVALIYAEAVYSRATEKNWRLTRGIAAYYMALLKGRRVLYGEGVAQALVDAKFSKQLLENTDQKEWIIRSCNLIGIYFDRSNELDSAFHFLTMAMQLVTDEKYLIEGSELLKAEILHDFANYYGRTETAIADSLFQESYKCYKATNKVIYAGYLQFDWAKLFYDHGEFNRAENLLDEGLKAANQLKDLRGLTTGYQKLGVLHNRRFRKTGDIGDFEESMNNYLKCFQYQKGDLYFLHNQIGQNYQRAASIVDDELTAFAYVDSALVSYRRAMDEARKEGALSVLKKMGKNISQLCSWRSRRFNNDCSDLLGSPSADFLNYNYAGITDTIGNILYLANERNRKLERREFEIKGEQKSKIQLIASGASLLVIAMVFIVLLQRQQQKRLKAKMEALRAQINPHFISNSLNAIESLVNLDKKEEASKYLIHFSRLSRRILNSSREGNASLAEEIQTLEHFLALEQLRFRDKLQYLIDIDEDLNPKQVEMPAMLLQPYVENAIWHGIKPKTGIGLVKIQIEREGKFLFCTVKDNGIGRTKSAEIKSTSVLQQKSVAMKINQERLNVVGRAKGAKVDITDLYDENGTASGTKVTIRLPYKSITSR